MEERITSRELDTAARPLLDDLRAYSGGDRSPGRKEAVETFLKTIRASGQRMGAENNEANMILKFGKAAGASPEDIMPIFRSLASRYGASGAVETETPQALAPGDSNRAIPVRRQQRAEPERWRR